MGAMGNISFVGGMTKRREVIWNRIIDIQIQWMGVVFICIVNERCDRLWVGLEVYMEEGDANDEGT